MMLLFDVYLILAAVPAFCTWFFIFGNRSPWFLLLIVPFYFGYVLALNAFHFVWAFIWSLIIKRSPVPEHPKKLYNYLTVSTIDIIDRFAGARVKGFDRSALPDGPCLFVSNHRSNFDPMVKAVYMKDRRICFLSKEGNFKVPIAGPFINKAGYLCIDREDSRKALEAINMAVARVKEDGFSIGVYPEGTRSKTGELGDFKDGVFLIAKKANIPVVVLTVSGTERIHKNFFRRKTPVQIKLAGIIDVDTVCENRTAAISKMAREMVEKSL